MKLDDHCYMQTQLDVDNHPTLMACPLHTSLTYLQTLDLLFLSDHLFKIVDYTEIELSSQITKQFFPEI